MKKLKKYSDFICEDNDWAYQGDKLTVKIVKCDDTNKWYNGYIGETFTVVNDTNPSQWKDGVERYKVVPDNRIHGVNYVKKEDCEII